MGLKWSKGAIYLGVYISNNVEEAVNKNFKDKIQKIGDILKLWSLRKLTLIGKIQIINTLIISQLLYIGTVMSMPKSYIEEYKQIIKDFIWNKKPPKIKYTTLVITVQEGGLNLNDLECKIKAIKIKLVKNIINEKHSTPWKSYINDKNKTNINKILEHNLFFVLNNFY